MSEESIGNPRTKYDQRGQQVFGYQFNISGNVEGEIKVQLPPLEPSRAMPPAPPPDFVGRTEQLAQLATMLTADRSAAITALQGMGGIGKTAMAQQLAATLVSHFSGGIFWADLALHAGSAETILRAWGAFCGADLSHEPNPVVLSERVRALLAMRRDQQGALLAVLDDVRTEWLYTAQLLQKSLPVGTPMLVTMRDVDLAVTLNAQVAQLDVLPEVDAYNLLYARIKPKKILTPEATVRTLLKHLGYLPLAIRLAAGHVSKFARKPGFDLGQFVDDVAQRAMTLLDAAGGAGLAATFAISYDALDAVQQRVFRYCSVYSAELLTVEHMAGLLGMEANAVETVLDDLVLGSLLEWDRDQRYTLHPLLRQYSYNLLQKDADIRNVHKQAAEHLLLLISKGPRTPKERLEEVDQWEQAEEWENLLRRACALVSSLDRLGYWNEIEHRLVKAHSKLHETINDQLAAMLWRARGSIALDKALWRDAIDYYGRALLIYDKLGDRLGIASTWVNLGESYHKMDEWDQAIDLYKQALTIFKQEGDVVGIARAWMGQGTEHDAKGEWDKAIHLYEQSLTAFEQLGDSHGMAKVWLNLGSTYSSKGQLDKAIYFYEQSLIVEEREGDIYGMAIPQLGLGTVYGIKGNWEQAINYFEQAMQILEQIGDYHIIAQTRVNVGNVYQGKGLWDKAISNYEQALLTFEQIGDRHHIATTVANLSAVYYAKGEFDKANGFWEQAFQIYEQLGNHRDIATMWIRIGAIYHSKLEFDKAINYYEQALEICKQIGDQLGLEIILYNLAFAYQNKDEGDKAISFYEQSLAISAQVGIMRDVAKTKHNMGIIYQNKGEWDQAITYYEGSLTAKKQNLDSHGIEHILNNLVAIHQNRGEWNKAVCVYEQVVQIYQEVGDLNLVAQTTTNLGIMYYTEAKWGKAIECYEQALQIYTQLGDQQNMALLHYNLGLAYLSNSETEIAINHYKCRLQLYEKLGNRYNLAHTYSDLSGLYYSTNNLTDAVSYMAHAYLIFSQLGAAETQEVAGYLAIILGSPEVAQTYLEQMLSESNE